MTAVTLRRPLEGDSSRLRPHIGGIARYGLLTTVAVIFLFPLWWAMSNSVKPPAEIITDSLAFNPSSLTLDSYRSMLDSVPLLTGFRNTAIVVVIKGAITLVFCPLAGYAFAKYDFRFKNLLFGAVLLTLMLPVLVLIVPCSSR